MARKANEDVWGEVQKAAGGDYFIMDDDTGKVTVELLSEHYVIEPGDKDLAERIWEHDWTKNEIKALVDEESKILELGGPKSPFLRAFIAKWKKNGFTPSTIIGTKWEVEKTGEYEYDIKYVGRKDENTSSTSAPKEEPKEEKKEEESGNWEGDMTEEYKKIKETIMSLKDEPELSEGKSKDAFLAIVALKAKIAKADVQKEFMHLVANNVITEVDGQIVIS